MAEGITRPTEGQPRAWAHVATTHLGLLATLTAFLIVAAKALSVAGLDPSTALTLVEHAGPVSVLVGALLVGFPILLLIVVIVALVLKRLTDTTLDFLFAPLLGLGFLVVPWIDFVVLSLLIVAISISRETPHTPSRLQLFMSVNEWLDRNNRGSKFLSGLLVVLILAFFAGGIPWVPLETLVLEHEDIVGYVIADDSQWTHVLIDDTRQMRRLASDEISARTLCYEEGRPQFEASIAGKWGARQPSIAQLVSRNPVSRPTYAECGV
ncbi:MAG: hypothetical protein M3N53_03440 [Actinomycetota bacterium]|nr:hypothetical protein [Actinomycetota bacterium]